MEKWRISFDSQALSEYERLRPVNARVRAVWALGEEGRIGKGAKHE